MTTMQRAIGAIVRAVALSFALLACRRSRRSARGLVRSQRGAESELQQLPHMTPAIVKG